MLFVVAVRMVGAAYAAVPLYYAVLRGDRLWRHDPRADGNAKGIIEREMTVRFDANIVADIPWQVTPADADHRQDRHGRDHRFHRPQHSPTSR